MLMAGKLIDACRDKDEDDVGCCCCCRVVFVREKPLNECR